MCGERRRHRGQRALEALTVGGEGVDRGSGGEGVAVATDVVGAQGVDADQEQIGLDRRRVGGGGTYGREPNGAPMRQPSGSCPDYRGRRLYGD